MASEDEAVATYLQKHKIRAIFEDIEAKLGKELPPDPIAFIITKLQALEKASKKSPTATASPKRIASSIPKVAGKAPGTAKPAPANAAGGHHPPSVPALPKSTSSPSTTAATTTKSTSSPSRPSTAGSRVPTKPKAAAPSAPGATRPGTAAPALKGGRGGVAQGKVTTATPVKATTPVAKSKVGVAKVGGAKEEGTVKLPAKSVTQRLVDEEEGEGKVKKLVDEDGDDSTRDDDEELEMGMSGNIAGTDGDNTSEDEEEGSILTTAQDEVKVDQLLDAHRKARLPRTSCTKAAKAILELRCESPSLGYVSDASDEGEAEGSGGAKLAEDQEGIASSVPKVVPSLAVSGDIASIRSLLCERCAALLASSEATPISKVAAESGLPVAGTSPQDVVGTELPVKKEADLNVQHDRYGWGR